MTSTSPITLGILGGGQLGRMLGLAATPLGVRTLFVDPEPSSPARDVGELIVAAYDDAAALARLARESAAVTCEFENVPAGAARRLAELGRFYPSVAALETAQERLAEKRLFAELGIGTAPFAPVDGPADFDAALRACGTPAILKTRRQGYDGKGQASVREAAELARAWESLGREPAILEGRVSFVRELSILAVGGRGGESAFYPLVQNHHEGGILRTSIAPAPSVSAALQARAQEIASRVMERLGYVGVLAIEFFEVRGADGQPELLANEMACRVHNSGHWSIEGAECGQFENHVRAVLGMPLGSTRARGFSGMVNLIGAAPAMERLLAIPGAHVHWYGKDPRPGRKLGHVTVCAATEAERDAGLEQVKRALEPRAS